MSNPVPPSVLEQAKKYAEQRVVQNAVEDSAGRAALATPLAGATADAFAPQPSITVGKYEVRSFVDVDFEFLQWLEHPLYKMMTSGLEGKQAEDAGGFMPRGAVAWQLCYIMTRPARETAALFRKGGVQAVKDAAQDEMGEHTIGGLNSLCEASLKQMTIYWSTVIKYEAAEMPTGDGEAKTANPPLSAAR